MTRTGVIHSKWARNNSHKYGMKKIGLFIANGQRINYTSMRRRDLVLFIVNGQRINYTSMG
jgi:hypothetical protein